MKIKPPTPLLALPTCPPTTWTNPSTSHAAAKYEEIVRALLINVANRDHRPEWKPDSFFRRYAESAKIGQ